MESDIYNLPTSIEISGALYEIRSDYRAILDICMALSDHELDDRDRAYVALDIFYPELENIQLEHYQEAVDKCLWFINGGQEDNGPKSPRLMDWKQDFQYIVAPVNRVIGQEIRAMSYLHWWSLLSAYMEIGGDCTFAQIVSIRDKQARGKKLEKHEQEWLRRNRHLVDFKRKYTQEDDEIFNAWFGA